MKNLANCSPREFLKQTTRIRRAAEKWLKITDIMRIRSRKPELPEGATKEQISEAIKEQAYKNLSAMLDAIMEEHPDETIDLLALCCFIEPEQADEHPTSEYMGAIADMLENEDVWRFFTSLMRLGQTLSSKD